MPRPGLNPSWIVVAAGVSASLHVGKLPPAVPVLQQELGISLVQAGFLLSTVQVAGMALGLVVGLGADKWGLRRSMLTGLALMALSSLVGAAATGFAWLLALRVLEGLGFLLVAMPAPGLIRRNVNAAELSGRMGWWGSYMPIGSAIGLLLGPWVLQATSWQAWWIALGCSSLLAFIAVWRMVPADAARISASATPAVADSGSNGWRPRLALTLRSPGPWLVSLAFMLYSGQWMGVVGFLPTMYAQAGLSAKLAGMLTAVVAAANMVGNIASGKLMQRGWSPRRCLQIGYVAMGLCALLAYVQFGDQPLAPLWLRFVAVVLFSAAGGLIPATLFTSAMHLAPSPGTVSTTVGFMQQWSCVGQFAGPPLVAAVATAMGGWQFTWLVTGSMCAGGWLLALGIDRCWHRLQR
ncbi:CynX/NimT family MFS transporter [Comamonas resistens]|uniref:MFS transporter n=1 Tax=Comamonas resistens TaxID=3046670 RepID=A0ABY8SXZ1_9BURK|nr:MFS transporter [Comamonas resistens]MDL5038866.1 MFS transporter [Comamonas resistens]WHS67918.1 MFS transporter [Comamonas resistens]